MEKSVEIGMQTFDQALFQLFQDGKISEEEALKNADSQNNVRLKIKFAGDGIEEESLGLSLEPTEEEEEAPEAAEAPPEEEAKPEEAPPAEKDD